MDKQIFFCLLKSAEYRVLYKLMGWLHWLVCGKCIQRYIFVLNHNNTSDWVWLLIHEVSSRTTGGRTPLLWTSGQLGGIRTHDPTMRKAADLRLRPRGHWDLHGQAVCSVTRKFQASKEFNSIQTAHTHWTLSVFNDARFYITHILSTRHASSPFYTGAYFYAAYFPDSSVEGVETLL